MEGLEITPCSLSEAFALQSAIVKAMREAGINISMAGANDADVNVGSIIEAALNVATDEKVRTCLFKCAERGLYNKQKIDLDFFEKTENREFYYPIMLEVLKVNLSPFFGKVSSLLSSLPEITGIFQQQK